MGSAEQNLAEWLEFALAVLDHRTDVVGEEIGLDVRSRRYECPCRTAITLEFGLDSNHVSEEIRERAAPAVEREAADDVAVLGIKPHVGVVCRYLHLGVTLRERRAPEKQDESNEKCLLHFSASPIQIFTPLMPAIRGNRHDLATKILERKKYGPGRARRDKRSTSGAPLLGVFESRED